MSENINNTEEQKRLLGEILRQIHRGADPAALRGKLVGILKNIPYDAVVEVEQSLLAEGLPVEELQKFCDVHSAVLEGHITSDLADLPPGHPLSIFKRENQAVLDLVDQIRGISPQNRGVYLPEQEKQIRIQWQKLMDLDKHYRRKEYLLFPYLEKKGIEGPPKVMWGKHDEIRSLLKDVWSLLKTPEGSSLWADSRDKALSAVVDMTTKEESIFLPLCQETLEIEDWKEVYTQTQEYGYCLIDPQEEWEAPGTVSGEDSGPSFDSQGLVRLFSGTFTPVELTAVLNALPVDLTFVDAQDKVRYFSQGQERIFDRSRAILGRDVRLCHPPHSVSTVERILADFKAGIQHKAPFWIQMGGKFIHIEYFALRDKEGNYLGCLEVSQDLTAKRALTGEQRLLAYGGEK